MCVCVCVREREREREPADATGKTNKPIRATNVCCKAKRQMQNWMVLRLISKAARSQLFSNYCPTKKLFLSKMILGEKQGNAVTE